MIKYYLIIVCLILILGGCGYYSSGNTAEQALHNHLVKQNEQSSINIISSRSINNGAIILYTKSSPLDNQAALFFQIVWQDKATWYTDQCCDGGGSTLSKMYDGSDVLVTYNSELRGRRHIVTGRTVNLKVAFVEARFSDGTVIRDTVKDDVFAIVGPDDAINICEIRVYNKEALVLHTITNDGVQECTTP